MCLNLSVRNGKLVTNQIFGGRPQEDLMQEEKDINGSIMKVNIFLAIAATLLSLIGMFNLVSLDIIRRTKEIGIRKIQGAPVPVDYVPRKQEIPYYSFHCFNSRMCRRILFVAMLMDSIWDYFVDIGAGICFSSSDNDFCNIATLIFKIIRAAMKNPVDSLRYE